MNDEILDQFDLAWALADLHLSALVDDDFLWQPAPLCWTVPPSPAFESWPRSGVSCS